MSHKTKHAYAASFDDGQQAKRAGAVSHREKPAPSRWRATRLCCGPLQRRLNQKEGVYEANEGLWIQSMIQNMTGNPQGNTQAQSDGATKPAR